MTNKEAQGLFKFLRFLATTGVLIILVSSLGLSNWRTWVVYILMYTAMLCDFLYSSYGGYND